MVTTRSTTLDAGTRAPWLHRLDPALLIVLGGQWLVVVAAAALATHDGWLYGSPGTAERYLAAADDLAHLRLPDVAVGYGWPLVLAPFVLVFGSAAGDVLPPLVLFQAALLVPLCVVLAWDIGQRLAGRVGAVVAAAAWVTLPPAGLLLFTGGYRPEVVDDALPALMGLTARPELPAAAVLMGASALLLRALQAGRGEEAALAGALAAFAGGILAVCLGFLAGAVLALAVAWRRLPALAFALALLPGLIALAVWRWRVLGGIDVHLGPVSWDELTLNMARLRENFWSNRLLQWLPVAGAIGLARASPRGALLLAGWTAAFVVTTVASRSLAVSFADAAFFVALIPVLPAYLLLCSAVPLLVPTLPARLGRLVAPAPPGRRPGAVALAAGAVLLGVVPLLVAFLARG